MSRKSLLATELRKAGYSEDRIEAFHNDPVEVRRLIGSLEGLSQFPDLVFTDSHFVALITSCIRYDLTGSDLRDLANEIFGRQHCKAILVRVCRELSASQRSLCVLRLSGMPSHEISRKLGGLTPEQVGGFFQELRRSTWEALIAARVVDATEFAMIEPAS